MTGFVSSAAWLSQATEHALVNGLELVQQLANTTQSCSVILNEAVASTHGKR